MKPVCPVAVDGDLGDRAKRDEFAGGVPYAHAIDVAGDAPVAGFRLDLHLPGLAEEVEVVGIVAAQDLGALPVGVEIDLRGCRSVCRVDAGPLGKALSCRDETARGRSHVGRRGAGAAYELELEPGGRAEADDGRQLERNDGRGRNPAEILVELVEGGEHRIGRQAIQDVTMASGGLPEEGRRRLWRIGALFDIKPKSTPGAGHARLHTAPTHEKYRRPIAVAQKHPAMATAVVHLCDAASRRVSAKRHASAC